MIAISIRQYPTTSRDDQAERELSAGGLGLSVPWSRLVQFVTMRTTVTRGVAEVEPKPIVERRRSANARPDDARAPRAAGSGGVALAARRD
jgi:hypothetical protein